MKIQLEISFKGLSGILEFAVEFGRKLAKMIHLQETLTMEFGDFVTAQKGFNASIGASIDGLVGDVKTLNDKITALQNAPGTLSPEQKAALDDLAAAGQALSDRAGAADALTPPEVPPAP